MELVLDRDGGDVVLVIRDDGRGFDPARASGGYGLDGMRRRLAAAGGRLDVASGPDGTRLTARIPAHAPPARARVEPHDAATTPDSAPAPTPARARA